MQCHTGAWRYEAATDLWKSKNYCEVTNHLLAIPRQVLLNK